MHTPRAVQSLEHISLALAACALLAGCPNNTQQGSDVVDGGSVDAPNIDASPEGGTSDGGGGDGATDLRKPCSTHVTATGDVQTTVQTALVDAAPGDTICFDDGVYSFTRSLSLSTRGITLQGTGDNAVLDFGGQTQGNNSILATGDGFTVQYLTIKNVVSNGVRVEGATGVTFRHVHALWDAGSVTANGAYALYPVQCTNVLIEDCEVEGAADAGVYVGQSTTIVVRRNNVHGNVAGIEIENSTDSCVYENIARDNVSGILVFTLPGLPTYGMGRSKVHDNIVDTNNRANFCHPGGIVCDVPSGIGVMVLAADHTEVNNNTITNNESTGVLVVDYRTQDSTATPTAYDPKPEDVNIHDNMFMGNGENAQGLLASFGNPTVPDILWDGYGAVCNDNSINQVCITNNGSATFLCASSPLFNSSAQSTDLTMHNCMPAPLPCVSF